MAWNQTLAVIRLASFILVRFFVGLNPSSAHSITRNKSRRMLCMCVCYLLSPQLYKKNIYIIMYMKTNKTNNNLKLGFIMERYLS